MVHIEFLYIEAYNSYMNILEDSVELGMECGKINHNYHNAFLVLYSWCAFEMVESYAAWI